MSPFRGATFFEFFPLFFHRLFLLVTGKLPFSALSSDEVQCAVLCLIAIVSCGIGTLLVVRRMTMLANSLSHTILVGIVVATILFSYGAHLSFPLLLFAALLSGILTTGLTHLFRSTLSLQKDASIGLAFTTLFAIGILLTSLYTRNTHIGLEAVMGNADALHPKDITLTGTIALVNLVLISVFFKEWKITSFDPILARSMGFRPRFFSHLLMLMTSFSAIAAFRAVGVLLFLAFLVAPVLIARRFVTSIGQVMILSGVIGVLASMIGVALSRHLLTVYGIPLSTAGIVTTVLGVAFLTTRRKFRYARG